MRLDYTNSDSYLPAIKRIAYKFSRLPGVELEEIVASGAIGLAEGLKTLNQQRSSEEKNAYLKRRIRGAILDYLRQSDGFTPCARAQYKRGGHFRDRRLDRPSSVSFEDIFISSRSFDLDIKLDITKALSCLNEREADIVRLYYWHDENMYVIGEAWGLTNSRVSQILDKVHKKLKILLN